LLAIAAVIGSMYGKPQETGASGQSRFRWIPLALFFILFFGSPFLSFISSWGSLFADFYQAGSLVFGGGHVVLPLLQELLAETISTDRFLLGYAAAQAVPGPMFSLAAFLGSELTDESKLIGALLATAGIFLPGFLLVISLQGTWETLTARPGISGAAWGINAAVVGLLMTALYRPVFISAVSTPVEMALVILGFFALRTMKIPIVALVMVFAAIGLLLRG
ncbi:MAG TPA: chorismate-binding protein, partial [Candidatus Latescibacteria bacterium]|nr:chorismate-binding protein [Candidatus Latescibacterota bacterium]